jgi:hypothetical protein
LAYVHPTNPTKLPNPLPIVGVLSRASKPHASRTSPPMCPGRNGTREKALRNTIVKTVRTQIFAVRDAGSDADHAVDKLLERQWDIFCHAVAFASGDDEEELEESTVAEALSAVRHCSTTLILTYL